MTSRGRISVIVPIYKVEKELCRCVDSIFGQTYDDLEILLVDDGSPDACPKICDDYAGRDGRVRVIHKPNGGLSDARNAGLKAATGKYVLYVDSDDYIEADACEKLVAFADDDVDIVVGAAKEVQEDTVTYQKHTSLTVGEKYQARKYIIESIRANEWYAPAWLNLYRRDFLISNALYYRTGYLFEDIDLLPRLFLSANRVVYSGVVFYNYIIRKGSIIKSEVTEQKKAMIVDIYTDWLVLINGLRDEELKKWLRGVMIKYYLASARKNELRGWGIKGVTFWEAVSWALNVKEKAKVILFTIAPGLYPIVAGQD